MGFRVTSSLTGSRPATRNIADRVWQGAERSPQDVALREGDVSWTYRELRDHVAGAMERLRVEGVDEGHHVLLAMPTSSEFVFLLHAIHALGAVAVTVNPLSATPELEYYLSDAECSLAIGWHETADTLVAAARAASVKSVTIEAGSIGASLADFRPLAVEDDVPAVLIYTSGTTGQPKGAVLTHANVLACGEAFLVALGLDQRDRMGTALPLFHVFGQAAVMATVFAAGGSLSILRPFSGAAMLQMAVDHRLTAMAGVPTMWNEMLHAETSLAPADFAGLRIAASGGASMPKEVALAFQERFGAQIVEGYGLSESTGGASFNKPGDTHRDGSVGPAVEGSQLTIFGEDRVEVAPGIVGEVAIKGPLVMKEYWNRPEATREVLRDGWLLTGDLGRMDEDGYLWIVDRKKDLIIRGGYNVYPREVEEVLYGHPAVQEAAVIGLSDERLGEEIAAVVAPTEGSRIDPAELRAWLSERLTDYKVPRIYHVVDTLPKGATGKILKRALDPADVSSLGTRVSRRG